MRLLLSFLMLICLCVPAQAQDDYVPILPVCQEYGLNWSWDSTGRVMTLEKYGTEVRVFPDGRIITINAKGRALKKPALLKNGTVFVPVSFIEDIVGPYLAAPVPAPAPKAPVEAPGKTAFAPAYRIKKIVLDPGHGGKDPGCVRGGIREKDIALDVSRRLKSLLEVEGISVVMTRDRDIFIPLWKRSEIANSADADLFISIHVNASRSSAVRGAEVYYLSEATDDSARALAAAENAAIKFENREYEKFSTGLQAVLWDLVYTENRKEAAELGNYLLRPLCDTTYSKFRGVKSANFYVLRGAKMPAVLVEMGFLSNPDERAKLNSKYQRQAIAESIGRGVSDYKKEYETRDAVAR